MVTVRAEYGLTDLDNEINMSLSLRRLSVLVIAIGLSAPLAAQQTATTAERRDPGRKPLNLSLPREAVSPSDSTTRLDPKLRDNVSAPSQSATKNDQAADETWEQRQERLSNPPYGTGFEARQRRYGGGFGEGFGGGYGGSGGGAGGGGFGGNGGGGGGGGGRGR
ncbi:MAG: hypothetical protein KJ634_03765 [Gammaproteobacteria bacterium]|nr:hypothetical protein [Gammaproteobacteria bacterium]MBU1414721.1 hypothetical protein [Gammaproteobacteria bacterium]